MSDRNIIRPFGLLGKAYRVNNFGLWCQRLAWVIAYAIIPELVIAQIYFPASLLADIGALAAINLPIVLGLVLFAARNGKPLDAG